MRQVSTDPEILKMLQFLVLFLIPSIKLDSLHFAEVQLGKAKGKLQKQNRLKWEGCRKMTIFKIISLRAKRKRDYKKWKAKRTLF